jgi:hypothetical protein
VTGLARVGRGHRGSGPELAGIEQHPDLAGIAAGYLGDAPDAVALELDAVHRLDEPVSLAALGLDRPPRSYRWLPEGAPVPAGVRDGTAALRSMPWLRGRPGEARPRRACRARTASRP